MGYAGQVYEAAQDITSIKKSPPHKTESFLHSLTYFLQEETVS